MNPSTVTPEARAAALDHLLATYAMAVDRMRRMQRQFQDSPYDVGSRELDKAEEEVDTLTALHLLPGVS